MNRQEELKVLKNLYFGRIMSPEEAEIGFEHHPEEDRRRLRGNWFLCGDANKSLIDYLRQDGPEAITAHLNFITSERGYSYAVISHRVRDAEHRFLVPASEPKFLSVAEAMMRNRACVSLGDAGDEQAMILQLAHRHEAIVAHVRREQSQLRTANAMADIGLDLPFLSMGLCRPDGMNELQPPADVAVTVIAPDAVARAWMVFAAADARKQAGVPLN